MFDLEASLIKVVGVSSKDAVSVEFTRYLLKLVPDNLQILAELPLAIIFRSKLDF